MREDIRKAEVYIPKYLKIRTKEGRITALRPKPAQQMLLDLVKQEREAGRPPRILVLKARQLGLSTVTEGMMFHDSVTRKLVQTLIVAHRDDSTTKLFRMNKLFFDYLPPKLQPMCKHSNAKELVFENPTRDPGEKRRRPGLMSSIRCVTANDGMGRSETLNNVHLSDFAFWKGNKNEILDGVMQAVPAERNTLVVIESTANGYNEFKDLWDGAVAGTNGWVPLFIAWFHEAEYRMAVTEGTVWDQEERALMEAYHLDPEQMAWRRWCIAVNCHGDKRKFQQEYPSTPEEAFLFSGTPFFNNEDILLQLAAAPPAVDVGTFVYPEPEAGEAPTDWKWTSDRRAGFIRVYALPEPGVPYVIGGDTAGEGSDKFTAWVVDNRTGIQTAELEFTFSELLYARQLYCLGMWYNAALIAVETNFSTYPQRKLEEWDYPSLYVRERFDTYTGKAEKAFGFRTTAQTRPVILAGLHAVMEEQPELVRSRETLRQMLHFVYDEHRKPQAEEGEHDDLVMAAAICHFARSQQRLTLESTGALDTSRWTADMWEDYQAADEEGKRRMRKLWGSGNR